MSRIAITVGGGEILAPSTPGHADGRYRVYLDVSNVAGTDTIALAIQGLQGIVRPGSLLGALGTVTLILGALQSHEAGGT